MVKNLTKEWEKHRNADWSTTTLLTEDLDRLRALRIPREKKPWQRGKKENIYETFARAVTALEEKTKAEKGK